MNEALLKVAHWLDGFAWSTALHESLYLYAWVETTHVLTLMLFLGLLFVIDFRMLGWAFQGVPASRLAERLDRPMLIGFVVMAITGFILYFAIPVRTTQSLWFRIKIILLVLAGVNAWLFRRRMLAARGSWDTQARPPRAVRAGAARSLALWAGVVLTGRCIAYDWFDCHKTLPAALYWAAGCVDQLAEAQ